MAFDRTTKGTLRFAVSMDGVGIYAMAIILVVSGAFVSEKFFTVQNFMDILNAVALLGMAAAGMAFITYSGNMADLSIPAIMAFSGIITVASLPLGLLPALVCGVAAGMLIGAMNGLMRFTWSNNQVYPDVEPGTSGAAFIRIFRTSIGGVPLIVVIMLLMFVVGHLVMTRTRFGVESRLTGSCRAAAAVTGINVPG